jgi:hypothetical protein
VWVRPISQPFFIEFLRLAMQQLLGQSTRHNGTDNRIGLADDYRTIAVVG